MTESLPHTTTGVQRRKARTAHAALPAARHPQPPGSSDGKLERPALPAAHNHRVPATESSNGPRCPPHTTTGVQRRKARTAHAALPAARLTQPPGSSDGKLERPTLPASHNRRGPATESSNGPCCPSHHPPHTTTGVQRRMARTAHPARLTQPPGSSDGKLERPTLPSPPPASHNHRGPATDSAKGPRFLPHTTTGVQRRKARTAHADLPAARLPQPPWSSDGKLKRPTLPASHNHRGPATDSSTGPRCPPRRPPDTTTGVQRRKARTAHAARLTQPPGSSDGKLERPTLPSPPPA